MGFFDKLKKSSVETKLKKNIEKTLQTTVSEIMTSYVISIDQKEKLMEAGQMIVGEKVSCVVVKDGDRPIGVVTERDFLKKATIDKKKLENMSVKHLMSPKLVTITPETMVNEAVPILIKNNFRKLVVERDGKMVGIVTQTDFVRLFDKFYNSLDIKTSDLVDCGAVMSKNVLTIKKGERFSKAKESMAKRDVGSIIVLSGKQVAGIITEYDVAAEMIEDAAKANKAKVDDVMKCPVMAIREDVNIFEANRIMVNDNVRRLPIVDGENLKGIITQTDMCRAIFNFLKSAFWHSHKKQLVFEKLEKRDIEPTLI